MGKKHFLLNPLFVFILSLMALGLSLFFYVRWYIIVTDDVEKFIHRFQIHPSTIAAPNSIWIILITSVLVAIILAGLAIIFTYYQKTFQLYRLQENFISNFTHELKTPIASLRLFLETFKRHKLSEKERAQFLTYMERDTERLAGNVEQILLLAQIDNGKRKDYCFEAENVETYIRRFVHENAHLFTKIKVTIQNDSSHFHFPLNRDLFSMVLMNLLTNALKYSTADPTLEISFEKTSRNFLVHFRDNGLGFTPNQSKSIFRKFYQVSRKDGYQIKGSGLGLYLSQLIMKMHRGKILAKSQGPGLGAVFTLSFPLRKNLFPKLQRIPV